MISLALLLTLAPAPQAPAAVVAADEPSVTRFYDLRAAMPRTSESTFDNIVYPLVYEDDVESFSMDDGGNLEFPVELLYSLFGQEFEYEGRSLDVFDDGRLMVVAPEALQARVARVLGELQGAFGSTTEITIDVLRGVELPPELAGTCTASVEQVRPLIDSASRAGGHERLTVRVGPGRPGVVDVGRREKLLFDYDCEVAEGALVWDPSLVGVSLGTRLGLRAAPGIAGLYLALNLRRVVATGEVESLSFGARAGVTYQSSSDHRFESMAYQSLGVTDRSFALNTFLPEGKVLLIPSRIDLEGVSASEVIVLHRTGGPLVSSIELTADGSAGGMSMMDLSAIDPPSVSNSIDEDFGDLPMHMPQSSTYGWSLHYYLNADSNVGIDAEELVHRAMGESADHHDMHSSWPWLAAVRHPEGDSSAAVNIAALSEGFGPDTRLVEVTMTLRENDARGKALASLSLPLRTGQYSTALLGVEGQILADFDVEIAKYATVEDPIVRATIAGLIVQLEPRIDPAGGLVLDLQGLAANARDGVRDLSLVPQQNYMLQSNFKYVIQQHPTVQLMVREELRFASAGAKRVVLGDSEGSLALEVSARW